MTISMKTLPEKRIWHGDEQGESRLKQDLNSTLFWNHLILTLLVGGLLITTMVTLLAMIFWCSRQQRRLKTPPASSKRVTSTEQIEKLKDIPLFSLVAEPVQPLDEDRSASSSPLGTKKFRQKNLLERRGSNNSLKISIAVKHRPLISPPTEQTPDDNLKTATRKLTIDELHQTAQDTLLLSQEFWTIPTNHLEKLRICGAGMKNRYGTIIANEHSRVRLPEVCGDPVTTYINANYVRGWPNESNAYIATQGPLANTVVDFYRMIWQENIPVVVMITRLLERNQSKCERYIPADQEEQYGEFRVRIKSTSYETDYEARRLIIEFEQEQREIDHYWYTAWPDQSCPSMTQPLIDLVDRVEKSRTELKHRLGPVVVHCSAGIGRTGCFIALSNGIQQLNQERLVDVVRIVCNLRQDRGGMIQTNDQYIFLYQALSEYARSLAFAS